MCGRFVLTSPGSVLADVFALREEPSVEPRFNIAPSQTSLVVRDGSDGARRADGLRWGLVPFWADDEKIGQRLINARGETAGSKPSFRAAFRRRRCLVPCNGFYEWAPGKDRKRPHLVTVGDGETPFALAGLWERWQPDDREALETFTILTTEANETVRTLHDRMPVIVARDDFDAWLAPGELPQPLAERWSRPWSADDTHLREVNPTVNDPSHDAPDCLAPPGDPLLPR